MDSTAAHAPLHASNESPGLHAVVAPRLLTVMAQYLLTEAGRKASLLDGGDGRAQQRIDLQIPTTRLHLVTVDAQGRARLKLSPRYEVGDDQRVIRHNSPPAYDAPPSLEDLFRDAARNHELERLFRGERIALQHRRRDEEQDVRRTVAEAFFADHSQRALPHPIPTPQRCFIGTERGRVMFDAGSDVGRSRDLPAEAYRRFRRDLAVPLTVMRTSLDAPDHTTISRRGQLLNLVVHNVHATGPLHLIVDSIGLSVVGEGEWATAKHGGRGTRGWKKLHLGVDRSGMIVAHALTDATVDDASVGADLIGAAAGPVASVTGDAAYDTVAFYEAASARHAQVVVPPIMTARVSRHGPRSRVRDRAITEVEALGRRQWKKVSGYHQPARAENAFFRYKFIIGDGLRARSGDGRAVEASLACRVLNRMTELGRPKSSAISR